MDEHLKDTDPQVKPRSEGCEDHLKEGKKDWVALNLCLTCGYVGCCDSSPGQHATKHFEATNHAIVLRLPLPGAWKWCYVHKEYVK